jgi:hypothetical protein
MFRPVSLGFRGSAGRLLVAVLLTIAAAVCVAELSGRWDQTLKDANDEAGLVSIVLCVGAAVSAAGAALQNVRPGTAHARRHPAIAFRTERCTSHVIPLPAGNVSPPIPLRI